MSRFLLVLSAFLLLLPAAFANPPPEEIAAALTRFRAEGTRGWSFTQSTHASNKSLVERFEALDPLSRRWTLVQKDGRTPTETELRDYREKLSRQSRGDTAPNVKDQIDPASVQRLAEDGDFVAYRYRLLPGAPDDKSARFMAATFTLHRPTGTITQVELASLEPFSPVFAVRVAEARTVMTYSLPEGDRPTLLQSVTMRIRGRAFWFRSLDDDLTVTYSNHVAPPHALLTP